MDFPESENYSEKPQKDFHFRNLGTVLVLAFFSPYIYSLVRAASAHVFEAKLIEQEALNYLLFYWLIPPLVTLIFAVILGIGLLKGRKRGYIFLVIGALVIIFANQYVLTKIDLIEEVRTNTIGEIKEFKEYFKETYEINK